MSAHCLRVIILISELLQSRRTCCNYVASVIMLIQRASEWYRCRNVAVYVTFRETIIERDREEYKIRHYAV